jgi:hypothetical protein
MAEIRVYIQPRFPAAVSQTAFYDFSKHIEFEGIEWEQNDQGAASTMTASTYSILPVSTTHWGQYAGANEAAKIQAALNDPFFHLKIFPRTEVQIRDVSTSPHTILWGGVITRVSETREGGSINGSIEAVDYTALLNEVVALEYTPLGNSTIKQTITSDTYTFAASNAERTAGISKLKVASISVGAPYTRDLSVGDTVVVNLSTVNSLSNDTFDGVHKITRITSVASGYEITFQQYSNVADVVSAAAVGNIIIPGFMTTDNAPQLDARINVNSANISDINPDWKWSPQNPPITRSVTNAARAGSGATITTSIDHGFSVDQVVTVALTNGPSGYANLNGVWLITGTPTVTTFTYTTTTTGTITSGAAVGTSSVSGEITPTPMKGGTISRNIQYAIEKGSGAFYLNSGTLDVSNNLTIDLFVRSKTINDLVPNGLFDDSAGTTTSQYGWDLGSWLIDTTGASGPYGVGNTVYYTGAGHQDAEMSSAGRISVVAGEKYFVSWRQYSEKDAKEKPRMKFYDSGSAVVGNAHGEPINQRDPIDDEWHRDWGIVTVPATAVKMSFVLHHESFASSYTARFTDIEIIKITGAFGFSDRPAADSASFGMSLKDFESPSAPEESGESANRVYVYAPYTTIDTLTGAKKIESYLNTYDFVQGVWEAGGKRIEGSIVELNATDSETSLLTAQQYFKDRGQSLKSFEFEHISGALQVGDVIPFIWNELGIAEALVVRRQVGYLIGQDVYYRVQLGGDISFQRSTMYLVERRLREISGDAAYFSPPPSPYAGYPTEGGIVTPAKPSGEAGSEKVDISWDYPEAVVNSSAFGGFLVLRSGDSGTTWVKASTGEAIETAANPLAPDTAVPSYTDTTVVASTPYVYKVAAIDVSTSGPIITDYSTNSAALTPTAAGGVDFAEAYSGLGINVPKVVLSVTPPGAGVAKTISTIVSVASTTATVTTSSAHGFSTGNVVGITGAAGTNNADVNGSFYIITVTTSTAFTITKTNSNILNLTGGTANGYTVSGAFVDKPSASRTLGDAYSLVQFPVGQIVYSEADGKLYRNGKHPSPGSGAAWNNYWTRAAVDAIDVTSDGSIVISADKITTGTLNAANVAVTNLNASNITTGTLTSIAINAGSGTFSVTSGGALTATSATITGSVTATSGTIGGYTIDSDRLTNASTIGSVKYAGLIDTAADTGLAFFAGATSTAGASAAFSVTNAGAVTASNLTVTGGSVSADAIDAGTLALNGLNSTAISGTNFTLTNTGLITATGATLNNLIVANSGTKPSILANTNNTYGELAVNSGTAFRAGHYNSSAPTATAFTARMGFTSAGTFQIFDGTAGGSPTAVFSVDNTGTITTGLDVTGTGIFSSYVVASSLRPGSSANIIDHDGTTFTFNDHISLGTRSGTPTGTGTLIISGSAPTSSSAGNARLERLTTGGSYELRVGVTSSRRFKTDIRDIEASFIEPLKKIVPRHFKSALSNEDPTKDRLGFIVEEVEEAGFPYGVEYESGVPTALDTYAMLAGAYALIRDLETRVAELEA